MKEKYDFVGCDVGSGRDCQRSCRVEMRNGKPHVIEDTQNMQNKTEKCENKSLLQQGGFQNNTSLLAAIEALTKATHNLAQEIKSCFQSEKLQEECAETGALIHTRNANGLEEWHEHDEAGNLIHYRDSTGFEVWYDESGNRTHFRDSNGFEQWYEYDEHGNCTATHFK